MGYLHRGHASLIEAAARENDRVVVSIFVNPLQFGATEDLASYPRDLSRDTEVCRQGGASLIFNPSPDELYPEGFCSYVNMEGGPSLGLCGASRPGHFRGVCTVVAKLLHLVQPHRAYFGQKDAQQLAVIRRMVLDLNLPTAIVGCPIVREPDGLALSSRNSYLSAEERRAALCIYEGLLAGKSLVEAGEAGTEAVLRAVSTRIEAEPLARIDYLALVDPLDMRPVQTLNEPALCATAVYIGTTRLIDNLLLKS
jgi:pantoate--beta-alanine ligase